MPGRTVIQWDKDDCEDLGIVKVDLLGLGMMAALQDAIEICDRRGHPVDLAKLPKDDPATYDMLCRADTIGVFQVESRAQMATLPRMKPTRILRSGDRSRHHSTWTDSRSSHASLSGPARRGRRNYLS